MTLEQEKLAEAILAGTMNRTADWLKFAETKNAALLAFASAWILAMGNLAFGASAPAGTTACAVKLALPFASLAAGIAIFAILPRARYPKTGSNAAAPSVLFYGGLAIQSGAEILDEMERRVLAGTYKQYSREYLLDLANQISELSRVAKTKYKLFSVGAWSMIISLTSFVVLAYGGAFISSAPTASSASASRTPPSAERPSMPPEVRQNSASKLHFEAGHR